MPTKKNPLPKKIAWGFDFEEWRWACHQNWYDGPFFDLNLGYFWLVFNIHGLPYIFQEKENAKGNDSALPKEELNDGRSVEKA